MQIEHHPVAASSIEAVLPGYQVQLDEDGVAHSKEKLNAALDDLHPLLPEDLVIRTFPCEVNGESLGYRCRCAFQIIKDSTNGFEYAMRQKQEPVSLRSEVFPIATQRIQTAMRELMDRVLNKSFNHDDGENKETYDSIKENLTSVTFASSWYDEADADCIITFHYDHPFDNDEWARQASLLKGVLRLRHVNGRSKKVLVTTPTESGTEGIIRDRVRIWQKTYDNDDNGDNNQWSVEVLSPFDKMTQINSSQNIWYEKPETAFYHPNGNAMQKALTWMLNRLSCISQEKSSNGVSDIGCRMLEMYCGCGAHTIALAKTNVLNHITAVEMDPRLVDACRHNIRLNGLEDIVSVTKQDAGKWAKRWSSKQRDGGNDSMSHCYDILLVDPPRMGLDNQVCEMAKKGPFQHFLYISCGRKALLRDLERLLDVFEVADCAVMDLFPRLDAVETLVHLKRRRNTTKEGEL